MKNLTLIATIFLVLGTYAQSSINLNVNHKVGNENLEYATDFTIANGDKVELDRCEYYISQIAFTHDGGVVTELEDVWILVDAFDQETYDLGQYDIDQMEFISFSVGVETPENNDDPTAWPNAHPLAPQNPSMHWGWAAGYRFLAMEGKSGTASSDFTFQLHALGNTNYHRQAMELSASAENGIINITLDADYLQAFPDVSTSSGGITHSESGDSEIMLRNFRDAVFSVEESVGVEEIISNDISIQIVPNPAANGESSKLLLALENSNSYQLEVVDITGKLIYEELVSGSSSTVNLPSAESGVYLVNVKLKDSVVITERWVVE